MNPNRSNTDGTRIALRALVVAPQPFFSPRGTPFSVYYRTLVMAQQGVAVDLLTYGQGQDVDLPGVRIVRIPRLGFLGSVRIGPSMLKAFLDVLLTVWTVALLIRRRYDFVHAHEEAVFWCRFLKPVFRFKLVYDMHSQLSQQLTNFRFTRSRLLIGLFNTLELTALRHADAVITICPELRDYAVSTGIEPARHVLIENSIFDDVRLAGEERAITPFPADDDQALDAAVASGLPLVLYAGTFEPYQGIDLLICAFAEVLKRRPDTRLLVVGGTPRQLAHKRRLAQLFRIEHACVFMGRVSKARSMELMAHAHVLVSPRVAGTNTPLKIYEQLASGKPLVATRILSHTQVVSDDVCILVDAEPEPMADGILRALEDSTGQLRVVNAQSLYERAYSRQAYEAKVRRLLEIVMPDAPAGGWRERTLPMNDTGVAHR